MAGGTVSNKELYDALSGIDSKIDGTRKELKSDIIRVETKFDTMEAGRLVTMWKCISRGVVRVVLGIRIPISADI